MSRRIVHTGRKIQVAIEESIGRGGESVTRDIIVHPGAVAILPLIDVNHVLLVRNQRPAVGEELWEIPAGTLEAGEPVEQAALRELAEETGYRAGRLARLGEFFPSPGLLTERTQVFVASDLTEGEQQLEADESITPHIISWGQAMAWVQDGTIRDAKTLIALMWYYSRREE